MTRVEVDETLCSGHARCHATAPEVYDLDDLGYVSIANPEIADDLAERARRGAAACPERALRVSP
ncbi:ferredoxin [soil metagenome]